MHWSFLNFFVIVFIVTRFGMFIRVFFNSSITMANWWSHSVNNLLLNFKTSLFFADVKNSWIYLQLRWSILNTTMLIVLVFSQIFHKYLMNCTQTFRRKHLTTESIFTPIIWFPEIISLLSGEWGCLKNRKRFITWSKRCCCSGYYYFEYV